MLHFRCIHPDRHRVFTVLREIDLVRLVGGHLDGNADQDILLIIVVRLDRKRDRLILRDRAQRVMVDGLFLQLVGPGGQPHHCFAVGFRNGLIGICRLGSTAGNIYIDLSVLDLGVSLQIIDGQLHTVQRIVVLVRGAAIGQASAAIGYEIHVVAGTSDGQRTVSAVGVGGSLCASRTAVAAGACRLAVISLCTIAIPVTIILICPTIGSTLCVPEICMGTGFTIRPCSIPLCTGCADTAAAKASIAIRLDLAASDSQLSASATSTASTAIATFTVAASAAETRIPVHIAPTEVIRYRCILVANFGTTRATAAAVAAVAASTAADTGSAVLTFCGHSAALDSNDTAIAASTAITAVTAGTAAASTARRTAVYSLIPECGCIPSTNGLPFRTAAAVCADATILAIAAAAAADTGAALTTNSIHCTGIYSDGACICCGLTVKSTQTAGSLRASLALNVGHIPCTSRAVASIRAFRAALTGVSQGGRAADARAAVAAGHAQCTGTILSRSAVNGQRSAFRHKDTGRLAAVVRVYRRRGAGQGVGRVVLHHKGDLCAVRQLDGGGGRFDGHAVQHQHNFIRRGDLHRVLAGPADFVSAGIFYEVCIIG